MKLSGRLVRKNFGIPVCALLLIVGMTPAFAQRGVVSDWSTHHVVFSNPGTEANAIMNGRGLEWQKITSNPRYRMQQLKRSAAWGNRFTKSKSDFSESSMDRSLGSNGQGDIQRDWSVKIAPAGDGTGLAKYPAEYASNYSVASCSDFVVYPSNATGSATEPNLVGFDNLYSGTCTGKIPTVEFAYYVTTGTAGGQIVTSPTLSEDGTKAAFVANVGTGAYFYVLTLANTGTVAAPTELTTTSASNYTAIPLANGSTDTRSSPYIDYTDDIAYVGDDAGYLHKFTGVFNGTPTEVTTGGWPAQPSGVSTLTGPIYDSTSGDIFVGTDNGLLDCVTASAGASCGSDDVAASAGNPPGTTSTLSGTIFDAPIVDPIAETVYSEAVYSASSEVEGTRRSGSTPAVKGTTTSYVYAVLMQDNIASFGTAPIGVNMGTVEVASTGSGVTPPAITLTSPNLYDGDFDNAYYNSTADNYSGNLYFCGNVSVSDTGNTGAVTYDTTPELYRIGFNSDGTMTTSPTAVFVLAVNGPHQATGCSPLTEFYNDNASAGAGADYLFLSVLGHGSPLGCLGFGCVMSFTLPAGGLNFGALPTATLSLNGNGRGTSGFIIDNDSTQAGASQIYFGNLQNGHAVQASQAALQ